MSKYFKLTDEFVQSTGNIDGWNSIMCQLRDRIREGKEENKFEKIGNDRGFNGESYKYAHPFFIGKGGEGYDDGTTFKKSWWYKDHQIEPYNDLMEGAEEF